MSSTKRPYRWQPLVIAAIRKLWLMSPMRRAALKDAEVRESYFKKDGTPAKREKLVGYRCQKCGELFGAKEVTVHHVVDVREAGWDWNWFIEKMFCEPNGLLVVCKDCHKAIHKGPKNGKR